MSEINGWKESKPLILSELNRHNANHLSLTKKIDDLRDRIADLKSSLTSEIAILKTDKAWVFRIAGGVSVLISLLTSVLYSLLSKKM